MAPIPNTLEGAHVLIIGGTSGIGFAVARAAAASGAILTLSSSQQSKVDNALTRLRADYPAVRANGIPCDLGNDDVEASLERLFAATVTSDVAPPAAKGRLAHVVFTAGDQLAPLPLSEVKLSVMRAAGHVRFFAQMLAVKVASRYMLPGVESSFTLTTGAVAEHPIPDWSVMAGFASGLMGMTRALALDLRPLRVNAVSPGPSRTELFNGMPEQIREQVMENMSKGLLTGRLASPDSVAQAYLWLMKDSNVTGHIASTNGGTGLLG